MNIEEIVDHARWAYEETYWLDPNDVVNAFRAAIEAAVVKAKREITKEIRDDILDKAVELDADEDNDLNDDGVASLIWYAKLLNDEIPPGEKIEDVRSV